MLWGCLVYIVLPRRNIVRLKRAKLILHDILCECQPWSVSQEDGVREYLDIIEWI
jgi:hypothetical protein